MSAALFPNKLRVNAIEKKKRGSMADHDDSVIVVTAMDCRRIQPDFTEGC